MRKILMVALGVSLIAVSSVQVAAAGERHHSRKVVRTPTSEQWQQFRGARNSPDWQKQPSPFTVNGGNA
jgi:hypothetical protein